jgi:hypothetical protein
VSVEDPGDISVLTMPGAVRRAALMTVTVGLLITAWLLFEGRPELAAPRYTTDFYDLQGRAILAGRLDIRPGESLGIEAFEIDGRSYVYFGLVPSVLRLPVLAITDRFDGRLGQPSMLLASVAVAVALARLAWVGRAAVIPRSREPATRRDAWWTGGWVLLGLLGTVSVYLTSLTVAYHEAILWGVAFALLAYDAILRLVIEPGLRRVVIASLFALAAFGTRASVGLGPVVALGLVGLWWTLRSLRNPGRSPRLDRLGLASVGGAAVAGLAYAAVNMAKFGTLFRLPLDRQVYSAISADRQAALADNGGSLFGLRFVPTTLWQMIRPDAVRITSWAPWIDYGRPATVLGDVTFDTISRSASMTATSPLVVSLAVVGVCVVIRRRGPLLAAWWAPMVGAAAGLAATLTIAFVAHRYLGDALPLVLLPAVIGWWWLGERLDRRRWWGLVVVAVLGAWSVVGNLGLGVLQQRVYSARTPTDLARMVQFQLDTPGRPPVVRTDGSEPVPVPTQRLWILGDCEALSWADGDGWHPVEHRLALRVPVPLRTDGLTVTQQGGRLRVEGGGFSRTIRADRPVSSVSLVPDVGNDLLVISIDRQTVLTLAGAEIPPGVGGERIGTPVCDALQRRGGSSS